MNKKMMGLLIASIGIFLACQTKPQKTIGTFNSRLHTPNEEVDWYRVLGETDIKKHFDDFDAISWEETFFKEYESDNHNYPNIEVADSLFNIYLSVSVFPLEDNFQYSVFLGNRFGGHKNFKGLEKNVGTCYLLDSNDPEKVKYLIKLFFEQNHSILFMELEKLEILYQCEDLYQNIE